MKFNKKNFKIVLVLLFFFLCINDASAKDIILECDYNIISHTFGADYEGTINCDIYSDYSHMCYVNHKKSNENNKEEILNWSKEDSSFTGFSTQDYIKNNGKCPGYLYAHLSGGNDGYNLYGAKDYAMTDYFYDKFNVDVADPSDQEHWFRCEGIRRDYTDEEKKGFIEYVNFLTKGITDNNATYNFDDCIYSGEHGNTTCETLLNYIQINLTNAEDEVNTMINENKVTETDDAVKKFRETADNARKMIEDETKKLEEYYAHKSDKYLELCSYNIGTSGTDKISIYTNGEGDYYINSSLDCYISNMDFSEVSSGCFDTIYYKTEVENGKNVCYFTFDKSKGYSNSATYGGSGFYGGEPLNCNDFISNGENIISDIFNIIMIIGPILALVLGGVDFAKATLASDEDALKKAGTNFGKRIIAAILLFLLPLIINLVLSLAFNAGIFGTMKEVPSVCLTKK